MTLIGRPDGLLLQALRLFSEKLTVIPLYHEQTHTDPASCDVAVVPSSELGAVAPASSALKTGGYLYWELKAGRRRVALRSCLAALKDRGFDEIQVYWCRPSFKESLEMIPLRGPSALAFALSRHFGGTRRRLIQAAGHFLASTKIPARLISCRSIVARKAA